MSSSLQQWEEKLAVVEVYQSDVHQVVMNYFTCYGLEDAAREFQEETNTPCEISLETMRSRCMIRDAILRKDVESVIELLNDLDPQILEQNIQLAFDLRKHQLSDFLLKGDPLKGLEFVQQELAPLVKRQKDLLPELEEVMIQFLTPPSTDVVETEVKPGLTQQQLEHMAEKVDDAILEFFGVDRVSRLKSVVQTLHWVQWMVQRKKLHCPRMTCLKSAKIMESESADP